jgi:hypothetical protein
MSAPKPHVSAALAQLRRSVTIAAVALVVCAVIQLLVFGFAHFTSARWELRGPRDQVQELAVVTAEPAAAEPGENGRKTRKVSDVEAELTARVPSRWEAVLNQFSDFAGVGGAFASVTLAVLILLGVVVAGGATVPGVEKTVTAATWAIVLALICIPWRDLMPSVPFAGVFGSYPELIQASEAVTAGTGNAMSLYATYLLLPTAALTVAILACFQFREGVDRGVIVTSISELDQALEQEMATLRARGPSSNTGPRLAGALNMAIGERPVAPSAPRPMPAMAAVGAESARPRGLSTDRRMGEPDPGDPLKRPI